MRGFRTILLNISFCLVAMLCLTAPASGGELSLPSWFPKNFTLYPDSKLVKVEPWEKKGIPDVTFVVTRPEATVSEVIATLRQDLQAKGWKLGKVQATKPPQFTAILPKQKKVIVAVIPKDYILNRYKQLAYRVKVYRQAPKS